MILKLVVLGTFVALCWSFCFDKIFVILLENQSFSTVTTDPLMQALAAKGMLLTDYFAVQHPSQPNYLAIVSGNYWTTSDTSLNIDGKCLVDLLEEQGISWKVYQEDYPGGCVTSDSIDNLYYRKHNPVISFTNVQTTPAWCANIVNASQLDADISGDAVPEYSFYTPNINNDGHNTGLSYAANWLTGFLSARLTQNNFYSPGMLIVITFDEGEDGSTNQVWTLLLGQMLQAGIQDDTYYTHYSLLSTVEANWQLGNLGRNDVTASRLAFCRFNSSTSAAASLPSLVFDTLHFLAEL